MSENLEASYLDNLDLEIDQEVARSVSEASKWAKFISILMFIFCGLMLLALLTMSSDFMKGVNEGLRRYGSLFEDSDGTVFFVLLIIALLLITVMYYFLFNFSRKTKIAVVSESNDELNNGFNSLKIYFILYAAFGILGIISTIIALFKLF